MEFVMVECDKLESILGLTTILTEVSNHAKSIQKRSQNTKSKITPIAISGVFVSLFVLALQIISPIKLYIFY